MAGDSTALVLVGITVAVTLLLAIQYPRLVRDRFVNPIESARTLFGLTLAALAVWYGLKSGVGWMMALALIGVAWVAGYVYFEEPHRDIR